MSVRSIAEHLNAQQTPQSAAIPGEAQVRNSAGGYVYEVNRWHRLTRFLILGTSGGTYYAGERELTLENAAVVRECVAADAKRTVSAIVDASNGRAPKNDPAVLALAIVCANPDVDIRRLAYAALPQVCRIPTHLFDFLTACKTLGRGWSRGLRKAVKDWYDRWDVDQLAYELVKYQQRNGWSNRDVFRLSHPRGANHALLRWAVGETFARRVHVKTTKTGHEFVAREYDAVSEDKLPKLVQAFEHAKTLDMDSRAHVADLCTLVSEYGLTREMVPSEALRHVQVWDALLRAPMPLTAMVRNLGKMTEVGLLRPLSEQVGLVVDRLSDADSIQKSRLHPMAILTAMRVYEQGHGEQGQLRWDPVQAVVDALDRAFYLSFGNVPATGKKHLLALDVSGSMGTSRIAGSSLSCREAAAAMALVTANVERDYMVLGFTGSPDRRGAPGGHTRGAGATSLRISPKMRLTDVVRLLTDLPFGPTDCALPMLFAEKLSMDVDVFSVYTDNETWHGAVHPVQALRSYRASAPHRASARSVVVSMTPTAFTIADPADPLSLDVVGFDLATPHAIAAFANGD